MNKITQEEIEKLLPVIVSDLKHHNDPYRRKISNENIKRDLYHKVILSISDKENFWHEEKENDGTGRMGLFIKGYVRDVWEYLEDAYDLIHNQNFVNKQGILYKKYFHLLTS
jgi:hypothetical protein